MHAICKKYTYNHVHDATSLQTILTKVAGADGVRALKDAPAPNTGTAHSVANSVTFLNSMMNIDSNSDYTKSAYGASSDSGSSEEKRKSRERKNKKAKKSKSHAKKKKEKDKDNTPKKNTCPHCTKYHRKKPHRVEPDKCMWNTKYKGYRFKLICDELKVDPRELPESSQRAPRAPRDFKSPISNQRCNLFCIHCSGGGDNLK